MSVDLLVFAHRFVHINTVAIVSIVDIFQSFKNNRAAKLIRRVRPGKRNRHPG